MMKLKKKYKKEKFLKIKSYLVEVKGEGNVGSNIKNKINKIKDILNELNINFKLKIISKSIKL